MKSILNFYICIQLCTICASRYIIYKYIYFTWKYIYLCKNIFISYIYIYIYAYFALYKMKFCVSKNEIQISSVQIVSMYEIIVNSKVYSQSLHWFSKSWQKFQITRKLTKLWLHFLKVWLSLNVTNARGVKKSGQTLLRFSKVWLPLSDI